VDWTGLDWTGALGPSVVMISFLLPVKLYSGSCMQKQSFEVQRNLFLVFLFFERKVAGALPIRF
jgi:hypothetical protein